MRGALRTGKLMNLEGADMIEVEVTAKAKV
jgi:hypothetical protein